jgi:hypothetical protein
MMTTSQPDIKILREYAHSLIWDYVNQRQPSITPHSIQNASREFSLSVGSAQAKPSATRTQAMT